MHTLDDLSAITSNESIQALSPQRGTSSHSAGYRGYDHITWYVGNAKQLASYYITRMGFEYIAYRGLETGSRAIAAHVISNNGATFVLVSPIRASGHNDDNITYNDKNLLTDIHTHLNKHGDAVKDVAFEVDDARAVYSSAIANGAGSILEPKVERDEDGEVVIAAVKTYGDVTHTLVERSAYRGAFMPGYRAVTTDDPLTKFLPAINIEKIDHCVGNQGWDQLQSACE